MRCIIITKETPNNLDKLYKRQNDDFIIAVDGALDMIDFDVDLVIGDFDSLKNQEKITQFDKIILPKEKDFTDTKKALEIAIGKNPDEIIIYGGIFGERQEHFLANLFLLNDFVNIRLITNNTQIYKRSLGVYQLDNKDCYYSFFTFENAIISLEGFKYNLDDYELALYDPLCISNELESDIGILIISLGNVIVFESIK